MTWVQRAAVVGYGAHLIECDPTNEARVAMCERVRRETGATLIPSYDHPHVMAGQGTAAMELLEDVGDLDAIIAPVGGGGLMSGTIVAARHLAPSVRLFGAEPTGADDAARSLAAGTWLPQTDPQTVADGLRTSLGQRPWPVIRDHIEAIHTVEDAATLTAMRLLWERAKLMVEPSAAVPLAAVLAEPFRRLSGVERVGIVLSGGNADFGKLPF